MSIRTVTNMTDEDLYASYLYYIDGLQDVLRRLKESVVKDYPNARETWFSNAAYRWRCLNEVQEEFERRRLKNDENAQEQ